MGGFRVEGAKYLKESSNKINDAVNIWADVAGTVSNAWLPYDSLGQYAQSARISYETIREEALQELHKSTNALSSVREALSQVADGYVRTERHVSSNIRTHRPEIDDPKYG